MDSKSVQRRKVLQMKGKKTIEVCPSCGNEIENESDTAEGLYTCVECGKQGFDCCVPGSHARCSECEEREAEEEGEV